MNRTFEKGRAFVTNSFEETQRLGEESVKNISGQGRALSQERTGAVIIALYGELGSGKTTFVQGMAKGLGIKRRIISPTFVLVREHRIKNKELRIKNLYHVDLYRIKNDKDIGELGLEEIINDPQNIVAIEWAEKMGRFLPKKKWDIRFEYLGHDKRRIVIM